MSQKSNSFEFVRQIAAMQNKRTRPVAAAVQTEGLVAALCRRVCLGQSLGVVVVQNLKKKKKTRELLSTLKLKSLFFSWPRSGPWFVSSAFKVIEANPGANHGQMTLIVNRIFILFFSDLLIIDVSFLHKNNTIAKQYLQYLLIMHTFTYNTHRNTRLTKKKAILQKELPYFEGIRTSCKEKRKQR